MERPSDGSGSESEGEEHRAAAQMQEMRAQIAVATALNSATAALSYSDLSSDEDDDEEASGPGRGAPGRKRRKADVYGDPDESIFARDILALRATPDDEALLKKFRLAYRVPWPVFEVCPVLCLPVLPNVHLYCSPPSCRAPH